MLSGLVEILVIWINLTWHKKNAARVVTGATARCDTSTLMNVVAWPMLVSRRKIHRLTMFYQIVNGLSPPYLRDLLPARVGERSRYNMRTGQNFTVPLCRTNKIFLPKYDDRMEQVRKLCD